MRPGLVTWKCEPAFVPHEVLPSEFARAYGASLGSVRSAAELAALLPTLQTHGIRGPWRLHVFARDAHKPGEADPDEAEVRRRIDATTEAIRAAAKESIWQVGAAQKNGEWVLDVVLPPDMSGLASPGTSYGATEPWLVGLHRQGPGHSPHAGARPPLRMPAEAPSRAWLKLEEGLAFSRLPLSAGDVAVEIGSAPGGASWALLSRGLQVVGVDPGAMDARVLSSPRFTHLQMTLGELRREQLPYRVDWLLLDVNLAPQVALHQLRRIVSTLRPTLRGALLTLKLNDWSMAEQVPRFLSQVQAMGFDEVRATQLPSNRQEICVAARRRPR
jgi:23S rRNA (cytidine2498-2'-O)-methyltransferase